MPLRPTTQIQPATLLLLGGLLSACGPDKAETGQEPTDDSRPGPDDSASADTDDTGSRDAEPSVVFTAPLDGELLRGAVAVAAEASDDVGVMSVALYIDDEALATDVEAPFEAALATTELDDGAHKLKAVATDTAGQTGEAEIVVTVDNTAPELSIVSPAEGETLSSTVDFEATATDGDEIAELVLYVDGEVAGEFTEEPYAVALDTALLSYGEHALGAWAVDRAGNEATDTILVLVDNPPVVTFTEPVETTVYGSVNVSAEASDDDLVAELTLSQDGDEVASSTTETTISTTLDTCELDYGAAVTYEASARDSGGNTTVETLLLTVDQPLQVEIGELGGALDYIQELGASVSDDETISSVVFDLDGAAVASTSTPGSSSEECFDCGCTLYSASWSTEAATEGAHTLTVTVTNASGDVATDSTTIEIDYDHDDDGYDSEFYGGDDCDDTDDAVSPDARDPCDDGVDDDCDGLDTTCPYDGYHDVADVGYKWRGKADLDYAGYSVAGGYDADGDGYDDVLVGAPTNDDGGTAAGAATLLYGPITADGVLGSPPSVQLTGEDAEDRAGLSVAFVRDQDGDGYDELLIGATGLDDGGSAAGGAHVVLGPVTSALDLSRADATLIGVDSYDVAGVAVAPAGDVNGDDVEDLLIGADGADSGSDSDVGEAYIVLGPATVSLDLSDADATFLGASENDYTGVAAAGGGDTDGDGTADFALGSPDYWGSSSGYASYINGPVTGTRSVDTADSQIVGVTLGDKVGRAVGFMDANGDGYDDALAGAPGLDAVSSGEGGVYIRYAPLSGGASASAADVILTGRTEGGDFGNSLAVCEIDDDGFDDLVVGAYREDPGGNHSGMVYVFFGPLTASVSSAYADAMFHGEDLTDYLGTSVACAGDTDGDGLGDLVLGAYKEDHSTGTDAGSAYIIPFAEVP